MSLSSPLYDIMTLNINGSRPKGTDFGDNLHESILSKSLDSAVQIICTDELLLYMILLFCLSVHVHSDLFTH